MKNELFFEWPTWMGKVYKVGTEAVNISSVVVLPGGTELQMYEEKGYIRVVKTSTRNRSAAKRFAAELIFDTVDGSNPAFKGDWEPFIGLINAAAAVNTLFSVSLTPEEYERLHANDEIEFNKLKKKLSLRAASLLYLVDFDGDLSVELYRTGRCP